MKGFSIFGKTISYWWIATIFGFLVLFLAGIQEEQPENPPKCCKCCVELKYVCCDNNDCLGD